MGILLGVCGIPYRIYRMRIRICCQICWALGQTFAQFKGMGLGLGLGVMDAKGPA